MSDIFRKRQAQNIGELTYTLYRHRDGRGSVTMVTDGKLNLVQHTGYYPYGEPWREPLGQPYLFEGKERMRDCGLNEYDFTARRLYSPLCIWNAPDKMALQYSPTNPFVYCAGNPVKYMDPTGNCVFLIPLVKGLIGGVIDFSAQMSVEMANDKSFSEAFANVDWTSVGAATVIGATLSPGMSTGAKVATVAVITTDAAVDVKTNGEVKSTFGVVGEPKPIASSVIDASTALLPAKGVYKATTEYTKAVTSDLTAKSAATLSKGAKEELKHTVKVVESNSFQITVGAIADYSKGVAVGGIKSILFPNDAQPTRGELGNLSPKYVAPNDATRVQQPILIKVNEAIKF